MRILMRILMAGPSNVLKKRESDDSFAMPTNRCCALWSCVESMRVVLKDRNRHLESIPGWVKRRLSAILDRFDVRKKVCRL